MGALAVASAATRGIVVGLLVAIVGVTAVFLLRRRTRRRASDLTSLDSTESGIIEKDC